MSQGQGQPAVVVGAEPRDEGSVHHIALRVDVPLDANLVIDAAQRIADVGELQRGLQRREPVYVHRDVLIFGQPIQVAREVAVQIELEPSRLVVDERAGVADSKNIALAPDLGRAEEIVEVGVVQLGVAAPVVPLVFGLDVHALAVREVLARRHRRDQARSVQPHRV